MRTVVAVLMLVLPASLRRRLGTLVLGWDVHPTSFIGRSIILVDRLTMGPGASIGPFNMIKDLAHLRLDEGASIATRNWIVGIPVDSVLYPDEPDRDPSLILHRYGMITSAHEIDCANRVELFDHAVVAGFNSAILTHSLDLLRDTFITGPVEFGERSVLMSGCTMLNGTQVPARSIVSAGSVINTKLTAEQTFYRGNPAEAVRPLPDNLRFYRREGVQHQMADEIARWATEM